MNVTLWGAAISALAAISGIILGWTARARETKKAIQEDAGASTMLHADVEYIKRGVDDIRIEQRAQGQQLDALTERVVRVEESAKQAHKRIDRLDKAGDEQ